MVNWSAWEGLWAAWEGLWRSSEAPEWSPGALGRVSGGPERGSLEVFRGCMGSPGTVLKGLVRVSGGPERVHGVPKLEILSFLRLYSVFCTFSKVSCDGLCDEANYSCN